MSKVNVSTSKVVKDLAVKLPFIVALLSLLVWAIITFSLINYIDEQQKVIEKAQVEKINWELAHSRLLSRYQELFRKCKM